ncbi:hypothetical protein [Aureibacter tunicatorum]|uniref:SusE outer membrane protein domain-containing protein n=1 Tax=Aureibacter tunicatorum TaxID=866807 RepID=A0AAE3XMM7_9BACT|nr:hypothetical protein [Aureibacter tunicatorum]MDR6238710.1 hypothetical protein [Aureibacter tunicatorum]BDD05359.1 hypothetical protein AUTU_28420 [Aureibacter tunicatorum]
MKALNTCFLLLINLILISCDESGVVDEPQEPILNKKIETPSVEGKQLDISNDEKESIVFSFNWDELDGDKVYKVMAWSTDGDTVVVDETKNVSLSLSVEDLNQVANDLKLDPKSYSKIFIGVYGYDAGPSGTLIGEPYIFEGVFSFELKGFEVVSRMYLIYGEDKERKSGNYISDFDVSGKFLGAVYLESDATYLFEEADENEEARFYSINIEENTLVDGDEQAFSVDETGYYVVSINMNNRRVLIEKLSQYLWIPGSHNGWSFDLEDPNYNDPTTYNRVVLVSDYNNGIYLGKVWLIDEFKFTNAPDWNFVKYGKKTPNGGLDTAYEADNFDVDDFYGPGLYELKFDLHRGKFEVLSFEPMQIELPEENALWISGDHNFWDLNIRDILLETKEGSNVFEGNVTLRGNGGFEFVISTDGITHETTYRSPVITEGMTEGDLVVDGIYTVRAPESQVYKITVDLNEMTYQLGDPYIAPSTMHLVGSATTIDWIVEEALAMNNRNPEVGIFDLITELDQEEFKFVQERNWEKEKVWGMGHNLNTLKINGQDDCISNMQGTVFISANFQDLTYELIRPSIGVIGSAAPNGLDSDIDMTYDDVSNSWKATLDLVAGDLKFRAFDDWAYNWGGDSSGNLSGDNIAVPNAGTYELTFDLANRTYILELK